jgi:hypothetical protein
LFVAIVWKLLIIEPFLNENQINCLVLLESLQGVRFNKFYFRIFRAKVWKILIFEWILLLEIQTNCKNWVSKENSVGALNVNLEIFNCEN